MFRMTPLKEKILQLHTLGNTSSQISQSLNCTPRYVNAVIASIKTDDRKLDIPNYIKARSNGLKTQKQLAQWFHVSDRTIRNFEKKNDIKNLERLYNGIIFGNYFAQLKNELCQISDLLNICAPASKHLFVVKQILEILGNKTK